MPKRKIKPGSLVLIKEKPDGTIILRIIDDTKAIEKFRKILENLSKPEDTEEP